MILHRRNKFYPNWTISDGVITSCNFFPDGGHSVANLLSLSGFMTSRMYEGK